MTAVPQRSIAKPGNRFRSKSLRSAALAVSATAASASLPEEATATVIYDLATSHSAGSSLFLIEGTASSEIEIVAQTSGGMFSLSIEGPTGMGSMSTVDLAYFVGSGGNAFDYVDGLAPADTVDATLSYASTAYLVRHDAANPDFPVSTPTYAGFVFNPSGSLPLYGWVQLEVNADGTDVTLSQWAYEDTGVPIAAGATPEPTTSLLLGIGLMCLSAGGRRLRGGRRPASTLPAPS